MYGIFLLVLFLICALLLLGNKPTGTRLGIAGAIVGVVIGSGIGVAAGGGAASGSLLLALLLFIICSMIGNNYDKS